MNERVRTHACGRIAKLTSGHTKLERDLALDLLDARAERDENGAEIMRRKESEDKWADAACRADARVKELEGALAHERWCRVCAEDGCASCSDCTAERVLRGEENK